MYEKLYLMANLTPPIGSGYESILQILFDNGIMIIAITKKLFYHTSGVI